MYDCWFLFGSYLCFLLGCQLCLASDLPLILNFITSKFTWIHTLCWFCFKQIIISLLFSNLSISEFDLNNHPFHLWLSIFKNPLLMMIPLKFSCCPLLIAVSRKKKIVSGLWFCNEYKLSHCMNMKRTVWKDEYLSMFNKCQGDVLTSKMIVECVESIWTCQ